jgi:hypothetical protein
MKRTVYRVGSFAVKVKIQNREICVKSLLVCAAFVHVLYINIFLCFRCTMNYVPILLVVWCVLCDS